MIYLDNSATTYPKPLSVVNAVGESFRKYCANPGRSGHKMSLDTAQKVYECRNNIKELFKASNENNVIFTPSCTYSINFVIKGYLKPNDHVIISSLEHNCVVRPLEKLQRAGLITYSVATVYENDDEKTIESFRSKINSSTRLIICTHASNVFGIKVPVERICALAKIYEIAFCLDAAQSAGIFDIDLSKNNYDFVCIAGHKGLYSPMGIGVLIINNDKNLDTLVEGGTGSMSFDLEQPKFLPDRFESGTLNVPAICGLSAGAKFVSMQTPNKIYEKEKRHILKIYNSLIENKNIKFYTDLSQENHNAPVLSFNIKGKDCEELASILSSRYNIAVRAGLHCAPLAHKSMGTIDSGTVRISPSFFTTDNEINAFINAVNKISKIS